MQPEAGNPSNYFDTPARAERLQLLQHLLRNAGEVIYLRAPAGAGKTRFAHRLLDILGADIVSVWIRSGIDTDIASVAIAQLGLNAGQSLDWPDGVLAGVGERDLLIVVDDADQLDLPAVERLSEMHAHGGRVLLLGHGGLAETTREWSVQYVDLPPFTVEQSSAFLRSNAGEEAVHINDDLAGFLHHSAHGRPGPLLDALDEVLVRARRQAETRQRRRGRARSGWVWLGAAAAALVLGATVLFQDQINALFVSPPPAAPPLLERQVGERCHAIRTRTGPHPVDHRVEILYGQEGYCAAARHESADITVTAVVGAAGLVPTLEAIEAGKTIALANKETLVLAGDLGQHGVSQRVLEKEPRAL